MKIGKSPRDNHSNSWVLSTIGLIGSLNIIKAPKPPIHLHLKEPCMRLHNIIVLCSSIAINRKLNNWKINSILQLSNFLFIAMLCQLVQSRKVNKEGLLFISHAPGVKGYIKRGNFYLPSIASELTANQEVFNKGKIIMKLLWILVGLSLIFDATYSVPVESEITEGNAQSRVGRLYK